MSYIVSENILDEPIPSSFETESRGGFVMQKLWQLKNWVASVVPESVKSTVSSKFKSLSNAVSGAVSGVHGAVSRFFIPNTPEQSEPAEPAEPAIAKQSEPVPKGRDKVVNLSLKEIETALKGTTKTFRIKGGSSDDYKTYLKDITPKVITLLEKQPKPLKVMLRMQCQFRKMDIEDGEMFTDYHFNTKNNIVDSATNLANFLSVSVERLVELIESLQREGSGWIFDEVLHFDILTSVYKPLAGSSYIPLPKFLASKKAIINPKNSDQECFKWAVTEAVYPQKSNCDRITKTSKTNAEKFNWDGIKFPVKLSQISLFEKNNPGYVVNVLGYSEDDGIYPVRISKQYTSIVGTVSTPKTVINLMLLSDEASGGNDNENNEQTHQHYTLIKNMSRLVGMQTNKHNGKTHICLNCFNTFSLEKSFKEHTEVCLSNESVKIEMPKKGLCIKFDKHAKKLKVPFVIYADFESYTEHIQQSRNTDDTQSYTEKYQKHTPSGFCYYIVYRGGIYKNPAVYTGPNVAEKFCKQLEMETRDIYDKYFKNEVSMKITRAELNEWRHTNVCHICEEDICGDDTKVKDHCHLTGEYRGASHQDCNLKYKEPSFIPVIFHNLSGYDAHLFIKELGAVSSSTPPSASGDINCIANTEEKYISFTKKILVDTISEVDKEKENSKEAKKKDIYLNNRFIDSFKFMSCGLDSLVKNLTGNGTDNSRIVHTKNRFQDKISLCLRKGVYPYDYMDSPERLLETQLPPKSAFYSKLNNKDISDEDYTHAQKIWKEFGMKTMKDYHNLYLELDVLLLADVFENFREVCLNNYKLDPAWYLTAPGLSWDAMLRVTGIKLELLTDPDMLMMVENGTRGGVSMISNRYSEANNKYMNSYDDAKPSKYIQYLDANNLYGWAMSEKMPYKDFKWVNINEVEPLKEVLTKVLLDENLGYILEVDLEYPSELHDLHNDYPLAPETMKINRVNKLTPNLRNKTKYILHHRNLGLYLSLGLKLTKIHRIIEFKQSKWLAPYIALNTNLRTNAKK